MTFELKILPSVQAALAENRPVVALESTVITHGLPFPDNLKTAQRMEAAVRAGGAIPATIAIIQGEVCVGLSEAQLDYLANRPDGSVRKCSRRDFPIVVARREDGATTVAGTMIIAHMAGISVFATGGLGGVHRGHPFDVSADLTEMGRTAVTVVSSGAKQLLDLEATREVIETEGVTVMGYETDVVPAFYCRDSKLPVDVRVDSPEEAAAIVAAHKRLGLENGLLVTVPIPEENALKSDIVEAWIDQATQEADAQGIRGAAVTPWLLKRLVALSDGETLIANVALLENNGRVAGQIAAAYCQLNS